MKVFQPKTDKYHNYEDDTVSSKVAIKNYFKKVFGKEI